MEPTIFKPRLKFQPPLKFFKFGHRQQFKVFIFKLTVYKMIIKEAVHSILHYKRSAGHQNKEKSLQCKNDIFNVSILCVMQCSGSELFDPQHFDFLYLITSLSPVLTVKTFFYVCTFPWISDLLFKVKLYSDLRINHK